VTVHKYPGVQSANFILPKHVHFSNGPAAVAHTRCLTFLKPKLGGPNFDLEAIWEEHTYFEFAERSVAKTMGTMVQEPYVNHVPTVRTRGPEARVPRRDC
jgi:carboxymethylenebutenolidase